MTAEITVMKSATRTRIALPGIDAGLSFEPGPEVGQVRVGVTHPFGGGITLSAVVTSADGKRIAAELAAVAEAENKDGG